MRIESFGRNLFAHRAPYKAKIYFPGCFVMFTVPHGPAYVPMMLLVWFRAENRICGAVTYTRAIYTQKKKVRIPGIVRIHGFWYL